VEGAGLGVAPGRSLGGAAAPLLIEPFTALTAADWAAVLDEGAALLRFATPKAASRHLVLR
jgi:hypothetical protein